MYIPLPSSFSKSIPVHAQPTHKAVQIQAKPKVRVFLRMKTHGYLPTSLKSYETWKNYPPSDHGILTLCGSLATTQVLAKCFCFDKRRKKGSEASWRLSCDLYKGKPTQWQSICIFPLCCLNNNHPPPSLHPILTNTCHELSSVNTQRGTSSLGVVQRINKYSESIILWPFDWC